MSCTSCGAVLADGAKFCSECGTPVAATQRIGPAGPRAERRITSVLFGDLVGFTTLSESRDPEDVRELLSRYFETAAQIIARYGGTVEKYIGDAVMAVWGVPSAHEDDAERAVRAGLELIDAVGAFGAEVGAPELAMRVGIVTGEVAVTVGATNQGMVAGDAVNTASRVQSRAEPASVWVDTQTRSLAAGSIDFTGVGTFELKGRSEPIELFAATAVRGAVAGARSSDRVQAPLVGRRREFGVVKEMFHVSTEDGRPRVVVLSGDAGVGKSRLAWELRNYLDGLTVPVRWHSGRCPSYGEGVAFAALTAAVRGRIGASEDDVETTLRSKLAQSLQRHVPDPDEQQWLGGALESLLGLEDAGARTGAGAREELFGAWITWFERLHESDGASIVWLIDDAHLADDGLLDFVERLVMVARAPVLTVLTARPELLTRRPWLASLRRASVTNLRPLAPADSARLVRLLIEDVPEDLVAELVDRSEGNPLYAIETVRTMQDHGLTTAGPTRTPGAVRIAVGVDRARLRELAAPTSLQILVASRLDLLGPRERAVITVAAVLGHAFTVAAVSALADTGDQTSAALAELVSRDLLAVADERRPVVEQQYAFVQTVVRQVAYRTQSRRDRLARHLAAASYFQPSAETDPDLSAVIAQHLRDALTLTPARDSESAAELRVRLRDWLERAAHRAQSIGAPTEAMRGFLEVVELSTDALDIVRLRLAAAEAASAAGAHTGVIELATSVLATPDVTSPADIAQASALAANACRRSGDYTQDWALLEPYSWPDAMAGLPPVAASRLTREIGAYFAETGNPESAWQWQERSVGLAEDTGDAREIVRSINNFAITAGNRGHARIAITLFQACADLARQHHLVAEYALPLDNLIAYVMNRDLDAALTAGVEALQVGESAGDSSGCWHTAANRSMLLTLAGRWDERTAVFDRPLLRERPAEPDQAAIRSLYDAVVADARDEPVDLDALARNAAFADEVLESNGTSFYLANRAMHARLTGAPAEAAAAARATAAMSYKYCGLDDDFPHLWPLAADWLLEASDFGGVRELLGILTATSQARWSPLLAAQVARIRGSVDVLDPAAGRAAAEIERDLSEAVSALTSFGAVADRARAQAVLGAWLRRNDRGAEAQALLLAAQDTFAELGAAKWLRQLDVHVIAAAG